tara:strand:- start:1081 stop:1401 length:321 start_codon:yes stop_codon:yes gene_type:complete
VDAQGSYIGAPLSLSTLGLTLTGPFGPFSAEVPGMSLRSGLNPTLLTVIAPFDYFQSTQHVRVVSGLRIFFPKEYSGAIWIANIRFLSLSEDEIPVHPSCDDYDSC